jgi:hypothetical protein
MCKPSGIKTERVEYFSKGEQRGRGENKKELWVGSGRLEQQIRIHREKRMSQHFHTIRGSEGIVHPGLTVSAISLHECLPQKMVQQIFVMLPAVSIRYKDLDLNQRFSLAPSLSQCIHAKPTVHAMPRNRIVVAQHI